MQYMEDKSKRNLIIIISASILAAVLMGVSVYLFLRVRTTETEMTEMVEMLSYEKEQLEEEYSDIALEMEGFSYKTDNDTILKMLDKEQQRVNLLLQELKTVKVTNARRITELKEELTSVRKVLVSYIAQIDSLNIVNYRLTKENKTVRQQYSQVTERANILAEEKETLEKKVTIASQLEALNVTFQSQNARGRKIKCVKKTAMFQIDFSLQKNITAVVGEKTVYIRIATPDNSALQKSTNDTFFYEDMEIAFSAKKTFEYGGEAIAQTIYYTIEETLWAGDYRADIFIDGHLVGTSTLTLK